MRLGFAAKQDAQVRRPNVNTIYVITNANDSSVDNNITDQFVDAWLAYGEEYLKTYEFEKGLNLPHDLITPTREDGDPTLVYPLILSVITGGDQ